VSAGVATIAGLTAGLRAGELTPTAIIEGVLERIAAAGDDGVWIHRVPAAELRERASSLDALLDARPDALDELPLLGVPFAVKDVLDVAGLPTTAGCPRYRRYPGRSAPLVDRLVDAGALLVGKTNLDQFAAGLVGVRSPYGVSRNPFDRRFIPGGSSSGSAVAVAAGLVPFSIGTDTAGSGRVPAALGNVVGLKPTRGLISTRGCVPACRSLDCMSVFALSVNDAWRVLEVIAGFDQEDPYARRPPAAAVTGSAALAGELRFGIPDARGLDFCGDQDAGELFDEAKLRLQGLGGSCAEIDFAPFDEAAALLYDGPWLAERLASVADFMIDHPGALLPVTEQVIRGGSRFSALDAFEGSHRLAGLKRETGDLWAHVDVLVVPTTPTTYTVEQVDADPIGLNATLGRYTNFVNLLDLAAVAVPNGFRPDGQPQGITLIGPAFSDQTLATLAMRYQDALDAPLGATDLRISGPAAVPTEAADERVELAVVGAHLAGQPLNHELVALGGRLAIQTRTPPDYRLFALDGTDEPRPGLLRTGEGAGVSIELEVWSLSVEAFGAFVARVPAPLAIGTVKLEDGRAVKGFLCEHRATAAAEDITDFGGWRAYRAHRSVATDA